MGKNAYFVSHKKSKLKENGGPKLPLADDLVEGEIAINFGKDVETLSIKNESGDVVTFSSDNYYTEKKLGSGFTGENSANTVTSVIESNEKVTALALADLDERKLNKSAYKPTYTKAEIDARDLWVSGSGMNSAVLKGGYNEASGTSSVAEGRYTIASGYYSHAEGYNTTASGYASHTEGYYTKANGSYSHAEGYYATASGNYSHAEGQSTIANNTSEHASGQYNVSSSASTYFGDSGNTLFSVGNGNYYARHNAFEVRQNGDIYITSGGTTTSPAFKLQDYIGSGFSPSSITDVIIENEEIVSSALVDLDERKLDASAYTPSVELWVSGSGVNSVVLKGGNNTARGTSSVAEGSWSKSIGYYSHAEGYSTTASGQSSHAEGYSTTASGYYSHTEGYYTKANGSSSHAEGNYTTANGSRSHAEGYSTIASGESSHAEGGYTTANTQYSHAEGSYTMASGSDSHAEGSNTTASGSYSHAEGYHTTASGESSHAEGTGTQANGSNSHAEGIGTQANGNYSHTEGAGTQANNMYEHASGQLNVSSSATTTFGDSGNTLFSVGNGTADNARHNAFEIRQNGDIYIVSGGTDILLQDNLGGNIEIDQDFSNTASTNPISTKAVYSAVTENELVWANAFVALSGTVSAHTANTEIHVTAADKASWANKIGYAAYDSNDKKINFYKNDTDTATSICHIDATDFIKDGMVSNVEIKDVTSGGSQVTCLVISFNTDAGKQDINIPLTDIFDASNYYNKAAIDSLVGSGFTSSSITEVIIENERIISAALNNLDEKKLDASAYTPSVELWESGTGLNSVILKGSSGTASGDYSVTEGLSTSATSFVSHAEGNSTVASGYFSHAEGNSTVASGFASHTEGLSTKANGQFSHAEGNNTQANGMTSHAEGDSTTASGNYSHAEGSSTIASGNKSHAEGNYTTASDDYSHAEGNSTVASGESSHAEGYNTKANGDYSHAEGNSTVASGLRSHAEGNSTTASGESSHAEGYETTASGRSSHAEGCGTKANGEYSHAEGWSTTASGHSSHAEGKYALASGYYSHAEGQSTTASSNSSHAEGWNAKANGNYSHAEGQGTVASGQSSHAEGAYTIANGDYSHTEGQNTLTTNSYEHASGQYNASNRASTTFGDSGNTLFSVGNGEYNARHNAFEIRQNGDIYITSGGTDIKLQDNIGKVETVTAITPSNSGSTDPIATKVVAENELTVSNALNDLNTNKADKSDLDGLKLKKITQAAYDALTTKDPNTLYVIVN